MGCVRQSNIAPAHFQAPRTHSTVLPLYPTAPHYIIPAGIYVSYYTTHLQKYKAPPRILLLRGDIVNLLCYLFFLMIKLHAVCRCHSSPCARLLCISYGFARRVATCIANKYACKARLLPVKCSAHPYALRITSDTWPCSIYRSRLPRAARRHYTALRKRLYPCTLRLSHSWRQARPSAPWAL